MSEETKIKRDIHVDLDRIPPEDGFRMLALFADGGTDMQRMGELLPFIRLAVQPEIAANLTFSEAYQAMLQLTRAFETMSKGAVGN